MGGCLVAIHFCHMASLATRAIMGTPSVLFTQLSTALSILQAMYVLWTLLPILYAGDNPNFICQRNSPHNGVFHNLPTLQECQDWQLCFSSANKN